MSEHDIDSQGGPDTAGRLRIYLGAAAGVGKTYAMLSEGHRRQERGTDVAIAFVECHGRELTERLIEGIEAIPRQTLSYRGRELQEMDLAAVLRRAPQVALVDELAHTNVPGSGPHEKRWQDVLDLLAAGIDVITTVNIQHLESLADEVERMTGVRVRERVPDWVVRRADQIELVDSSPEQLRRRLVHGNIYPSAQVDQALTGFFRPENLTALRELALRFLAAETGDELLRQLSETEPDMVWATTERIMVAVGSGPGGDALLRRAARIAARVRGELDVVHVTAPDRAPDEDDLAVGVLRGLAADLGARWHDVPDNDPVRAIARFARQRQVTQIVIGSSHRSRWQQLVSGGSNVLRLIREAGAVGIDVHVIARGELSAGDEPGAGEPAAAEPAAGEPAAAELEREAPG
jgi:two-component system, OmpR family, sensor histidine kinase KdpD